MALILTLPVIVRLSPDGPIVTSVPPELVKKVKQDAQIDPKMLALIRASWPK